MFVARVAGSNPLVRAMFGWLKAWLGRKPASARRQATAEAEAASAISAAESVSLAAPKADLAADAAASPTSDTPLAAVALRLALLGQNGQIAGFEFRLPDTQLERLQGRADARAAARFSALLACTHTCLKAGRQALVALPAALLERPAVARLAAPGVMLLLLDAARGPDAVALGRLRARGVRIGVPDGPPHLAPAADFVWLQGGAGGIDTLMLSAQRWREARPRLPLMASGLAHLDEVEQLLRAGFSLAGGRLDLSRPGTPRQALQPAAHRLAGLLNHLAMDRHIAIVAEAVRADATLSYRLLRYANSAAIGAPRAVETVAGAVQLLGRNELRRWLELMLLNAAEARQASPALQESALARGRLLELLARQRGEPEAAARMRFTLGMFSMLEVLLQLPMAEALAPLRLGETLQQALLHGTGPLADDLKLAVSCDLGDEAGFLAVAERLGGVDPVLPLVEQAWAWAAAASGTVAASPAR